MAETFTLSAQIRSERGSNKAKQLRKKGLIPAIIYGHKQAAVTIAVSHDEFAKALRHGTRIVDLTTDGNVETTLIRDVQWDYLGQDIVHVDFARVSADERITVEVKIELKGTAPGATTGGILEQVMHSLEIECPAFKVPESIRVNIQNLQVGQAIHVKELTLPESVTTPEDPDAVVVHVVTPAGEAEEGETLGGEQVEPELIKKPKTEQEEGD